MLRRIAIALGILRSTTLGLVVLSGFGFLAFIQLQNRALDNCVGRLDEGPITVHWKSALPPHYVCVVNGLEVKHLPPLR